MAKTSDLVLDLIDPVNDSQAEKDRKINNNSRAISDHNHSSGKGRKIPSSRVAIDSDIEGNAYKLKDFKVLNMTPNSAQVSEQNSIFARGGNLFFKDGSGREVQLTNNGHVNNLIIDIDTGSSISVYYGWSAIQANPSNNAQEANSESVASFGNAQNRNILTMNTLLIGGLLRMTSPPGLGFYWPWVAMKESDINNNLIFYTEEFENQNEFWLKDNTTYHIVESGVSVNYSLFYNRNTVPQNTPVKWVIRKFL